MALLSTGDGFPGIESLGLLQPLFPSLSRRVFLREQGCLIHTVIMMSLGLSFNVIVLSCILNSLHNTSILKIWKTS